MKIKSTSLLILIVFIVSSCSNGITYSDALKTETSGRYLYNEDALIEVFYKDDALYLNWKGADLKPVALDERTFFVPDMYQKLRFLKQPETQKSYLAIIPENESEFINYAYIKVSDTFKTPSMYLKNKNYDAALRGFMAIKEQDSTSQFINEREFNKMGYSLLYDQEYADAVAIFNLNTALHPESDNAYDSLAAGYLKLGDSLLAFTNFKKALALNPSNRRAKEFVTAFKKKASN